MAQAKHKYRVSVYLGKDTYKKFEEMADFLNISVASFTRIMIENGVAFAEQMERGAKNNGKQ